MFGQKAARIAYLELTNQSLENIVDYKDGTIRALGHSVEKLEAEKRMLEDEKACKSSAIQSLYTQITQLVTEKNKFEEEALYQNKMKEHFRKCVDRDFATKNELRGEILDLKKKNAKLEEEIALAALLLVALLSEAQ